MKNIKLIISLIAITIGLPSCEKVIEIELESATPQLVIEAQLQAGQHPFSVAISKTAPYFEDELPQRIEDAIVTLTKEDGTEITIPHIEEGLYLSPVLAEMNQQYTLTVEIDNEKYIAQSYLPEVVPLIDVFSEYQAAIGPFQEGYTVNFTYQDPSGVDNFYRFVHSINGEKQLKGSDLQVRNDIANDGGIVTFPLIQQIFEVGDTVEVEIVSFDEASYSYFSSLGDIIGSGQGPGGSSAAPGNPVSNWDKEVLGYFSAFSSDTKTIIIE